MLLRIKTESACKGSEVRIESVGLGYSDVAS